MHSYFGDRFDAIGFGARIDARARMLVDGGGAGVAPRPIPPADRPLHDREVKVDGTPTKVPVTATDQVREAIKDGAISTREQVALDAHPVATSQARKGEQTRLAKQVRAATGNDFERDSSGGIKVEDGAPVTRREDPTAHEQRVATLAKERGSGGLDALDARIDELEDAGSSTGLDTLRSKRAERAAQEAEVVDVVEDKVALVGTLEAERLTLGDARSAQGRTEQIDAEIDYLDESIETDLSALSNETLDALERHVAPIDGIIEAPKADAPERDEPKVDDPKVDTRSVEIDYSTPEQREQLVSTAQQQHLLPARDVTFDDEGRAVYTVQANDSYWRIADMSDGRAPHEFDSKHFVELVNTNSERLGRDPQVGLIHPGDQVVLPGRSVDELVALLDLPTTETVAVEPPPHMQRPGGLQPY